MRPSVLALLVVVVTAGCGGGGGTGGGGGGAQQGADQISQFFAAKRYTRSVWMKPLATELTLVLDTAMPPASLAEAAAALSTVVEAHARDYRFRYVETGAVCGEGHTRVPLPPSNRDVDDEMTAGATAIAAALAQVQPSGVRSTVAPMASLEGTATFRIHVVLLITNGADGCGGDVEKAWEPLSRANTRIMVVGHRPEESAEAWLNLAGTNGRVVPRCWDGMSCGQDTACLNPTLGTCQRAYYRTTTQERLTELLLTQTAMPPTPVRTQCPVSFEELKSDEPPTRVFVDHVEQKTGWTYENKTITFWGDACRKIQQATLLDPVVVEVEVPGGFSF